MIFFLISKVKFVCNFLFFHVFLNFLSHKGTSDCILVYENTYCITLVTRTSRTMIVYQGNSL